LRYFFLLKFNAAAGKPKQGVLEVADVEAAIGELGKRRHKSKEEQALEILEAARRVAFVRKERKTTR